MGIEMLDIVFRLERRFGVRLEPSYFDYLRELGRTDITAGELFEAVGDRLRAVGRPVPANCWNGVRLELANVLLVSPLSIRRESRLHGDLGML